VTVAGRGENREGKREGKRGQGKRGQTTINSLGQIIAQRIRLDRASEASRDLNRSLDEPGVEESRGGHRKHLP